MLADFLTAKVICTLVVAVLLVIAFMPKKGGKNGGN
jgi:hypothetical protein